MRRCVAVLLASTIVTGGMSILPSLAAPATAEPAGTSDVPPLEPTAEPAGFAGPKSSYEPAPPSEGVTVGLPDAPPPREEAAAPAEGLVRKSGDKDWPLVADRGPVIVRFGNDPSRIAEMYMPGGRAVLAARTKLRIGTPRIDGDSVVFDDVAKDTDLRFDVGDYGVTQRFILRTKAAPRSLSLFIRDPDGALTGMRDTGDGSFSLGSGEQTRLELTSAYAYEHVPDAEGVLHERGSAHQQVTERDGGYVVRSWVDERWLSRHSFPIELDPDYVVAIPNTTTGGRFNSLSLARTLDTRNGTGGYSLPIPAQSSYSVKITGRAGVPATGVAAVAMHVAPVAPTGGGRLSVYPSGVTPGLSSHVQFSAGDNTSNSAIVKIGTNGYVDVWNKTNAALHVVLDVMGWYSTAADTGSGGQLKLVTPTRIHDSRTAGTTLGAAGVATVRVDGLGGLPSTASSWSSVILNVTAISPTAGSYFTVWPSDVTRPGVSSMNFDSTNAALITTKTSATGVVSVYNNAGTANFLIEVIGYYTKPDADGFMPYTALSPSRIVDTRSAIGTTRTTPIASLTTEDFTVTGRGGIPTSGVGAVALNVLTLDATTNGYVNVYNKNQTEPAGVSMLHTRVGEIRQHLVIVAPASDGTIRVRPHATNPHVLIEVAGWFAVPRYAPTATWSLAETLPAGSPGFATGSKLTVNLSVKNEDLVAGIKVDASVPAPLDGTIATPYLPYDGCTATGVTCTRVGSTASVTGAPVAAGATTVISFPVTVTSVRGCATTKILASGADVSAEYPDGNKYVTSLPSDLSITACEGGLGFEDWWSYDRRQIGQGGTAAVNMANGNLVLQQTDSTPIQGHGDLGFVVRRTYNSQDTGTVSLPGSLGKGWTLNAGEVSSALTGAGIQVPTLESATAPGGVVLVDRDGTKHLFQPQPVSPMLLAPDALPTDTGAITNVFALQRLLVAGTFTHLCVDQRYKAPAGVQLSLWRYVAVNAAGATDPCAAASAAPNDAIVAGYAAMRPDRLRTEYDATGRLISMIDGSGNELEYGYPSIGGTFVTETRMGESPRRMSFIPTVTPHASCGTGSTSEVTLTDAAGRTTRYCQRLQGGVTYLIRVVDPDNKYLDYGYHGITTAPGTSTSCIGGTTGQLCFVRDRNLKATSFRYESVAAGTTMTGPMSVIGAITDRRGKLTDYDYHYDATSEYVNINREEIDPDNAGVVKSRQRVRYSGIDAFGRVTQVDEGTPNATTPTDPTLISALRQTQYVWNKWSSPWCDDWQPDNYLCARVRRTLLTNTSGVGYQFSPDDLTTFRYNPDGRLLSERRHTNVNVSSADVSVYKTFGYRTQYVTATGANCWDDRVTYGGALAPQASICTGQTTYNPIDRGSGALFYLSDLIETLTPNGNSTANTGTFAQYRTDLTVDNDATKSPNARRSAEQCAGGAATGNSGLVCRKAEPSDGATKAITEYRYDTYGQRTLERRPAINEDVPDNADDFHLSYVDYTYDYFADGTKDLSETSPAGGWLKGVTDPAQKFVAFGYDAAGNVVRTWDRNVTSTNAPSGSSTPTPLADYPGTTAAPPNGDKRYVEDEYASIGTAAKFAAPWRSVVKHRTQLDEKASPNSGTTSRTVDPNGNVLTITPPRGSKASSTAFTTTYTYDGADNVLTEVVPKPTGETAAPTTSHHYDDYGRRDATTDANANVTSFQYDTVNRRLATWRVRGTYPSVFDVPGCSTSTGKKLTKIPTGMLVCPIDGTSYFDGLDRLYQVTKRGGWRWITYDGLSRVTIDNQLREVPSFERHTYDADGNETRICRSGNVYTSNTWPPCDDAFADSTTKTYRTGGQLASSIVNRRPSAATETIARNTTSYGYDDSGNLTSVAGPISGRDAVTHRYDALGRQVCESHPRSATADKRRMTTYDASGNVLSASEFVDGDCLSTAAVSSERTTTYTYDAGHRRTDVVQAPTTAGAHVAGGTNVRTRYEYDPDDHVVAVYGPRAFSGTAAEPTASTPFVVRTTYDDGGRPEAQYVPRSGDSTSDAPNPTLTGPDGVAITTQGQECPTGATGYPSTTHVCRTELRYDAGGRVTTQWLPSSGNVREQATSGAGSRYVGYTYSADDTVAITDVAAPDGSETRAKTHHYYNDLGEIMHEGGARFDPDNATKKYLDLTSTYRNADGTVQQIQYPAGVAATSTTSASKTHREYMTYDYRGNIATHYAPGELTWTKYTYFTDGLVESMSTRSSRYGSVSGVMKYDDNDVTTYEYDAAGNRTKVYSPSANAVGTTLTDDPARTKAPTSTSYTHDNLIATVRTPVSLNGTTVGTSQYRQQAYTYDVAGRKTAEAAQLGTLAQGDTLTLTGSPKTLQFAYYANGRLQTETGRDGETISHTYDAAGNEVAASSSVSTGSDVAADYYFDGLLRSSTSQGRRSTFAYDGAGREVARDLRSSTAPFAAAPGTTVTKYGDGGLPSVMMAPAAVGGTVGDLATGRFAWTYDVAGRTATETAPNGAQAELAWANDDTLTSRTLRPSAGATTALSTWAYEYDAAYRRTKRTFTGNDAGTSVSNVVSTYTYTPGGRVESFKHGTSPTKYLGWDHNGNRTCYGVDCDHGTVQATGSNRVKFTYRADNTIASESTPTTTYNYPDSHVTGATAADRCKTYSYDGFDRLTGATAKTGTGCSTDSASYTYDPFDRQVAQTVGTAVTTFQYVGTTRDNDRTVKSSETVDVATDAGGRPLAVKDASKTQYLALDGTGSVGTVVSSSAGAACQTAYDPFGAQLAVDGTTSANSCTSTVTPNTRWFNAERRDATTGNYQLGSRTYDPEKAAFLTPDSFRSAAPQADAAIGSDPLTANRYSYVNGDPVNFNDPNGHEPRPVGDEWSGFGCSDGDCRAAAAATREANRREYERLRYEAERPTPSPSPGHSPTPPAPPPFRFNVEGCDDYCEREAMAAAVELGCTDPACLAEIRQILVMVYAELTMEDREPLFEHAAHVRWTKTGTSTPRIDAAARQLVKAFGTATKCGQSTRHNLPVYCIHESERLPVIGFPVTGKADAVTYGHYIFCKDVCEGDLLKHEMVHVEQWERYGDDWAKLYIFESLVGGTHCDNKWERPAYAMNDPCQ